MFAVGRRVVCGWTLVLLVSLTVGAQVARASDGTTNWSQVSNQPAFSGVNLRDVACPTTTHCFAVGFSGSNQTILEGTGGTWTADTLPRPGGENSGSLNSVSCTSDSNCIAVGYYTTGGGSFNIYSTLVMAWDGANWTIVSSPNVGDTYNQLFGVDCRSNGCTAVGYWRSTSGSDTGQRTLVLQGTETNGIWSFSSVTSPDPGMTNNSLQAVRCPTAINCIAVGAAQTFFQPQGNFSGVLAVQGTDNNGNWTWSTLGTDNTGGGLSGVDCTSGTSCIGVGTVGFPVQTLVETWNGSGAFTQVSSPNPGAYASAFSAISCVSATNCSAVGNASDSNSGPSYPLVEQWDGANWWQVAAGSSGGSASLSGVKCDATSNTCVGVGQDTNQALVDTGAGYTPPPNHTLTVTRTGSGSVSDNTGAISCPSTCAHSYPQGTAVTLSATPGSGSTFAGWSGGGCSGTGSCQVTLNSDAAVTASFTGPAGAPPTATTSKATPTGSTRASFAGVVNPNGLPTTARFQYGLDKRYRPPGSGGSVFDQATQVRSVGASNSPANLTVPVGELVPNAVYHVRLVASNSRGTTFGSELTFTTRKDAPPPPPVLGKSEDVSPVSGIVFFVKSGKLVPLTEGRRLPNGTEIDAVHGALKLVTSAGKKGKSYTGTFAGALFKVTQDRSGLTTLTLVEGKFGVPSYASCKAKGAGDPVANAALSGRALQTLRSSARGRFRTRGRFAAGTVRGTRWTTKDRCDGTWIMVQLHSVLVTDFVKHITVLVHQGQHYLARRP